MIGARLACLTVASAVALAALGATAPELQSSARLVLVTATTGLIAPLFWPGVAATPLRTAMRVVAWSCAVTAVAAAGVLASGGPARLNPTRTVTACAMLLLILLATHAAAAWIEALMRKRTPDADAAREIGGRVAAIALALLGSLPLWLGPAAELLADRQAWIVDAVVGASPLTHLAVASGNDLLRNQWLYQRSNLAVLQFAYPTLATLTLSYAALALGLALVALAARTLRRSAPGAFAAHPTTEHAK
jgi:hypothetical protein